VVAVSLEKTATIGVELFNPAPVQVPNQ